MAIYRFYARRSDGTAVAFEEAILRADEAATERAAAILLRHTMCVDVAVYERARSVVTVVRETAVPAPV